MSDSTCKLITEDAVLCSNSFRFHFVLNVHRFALADRECETGGTQRYEVSGELGYATFLTITSLFKQHSSLYVVIDYD